MVIAIPKIHRFSIKYLNDVSPTHALVEVDGLIYQVTKLNRTHYLLEFESTDICEENIVSLDEEDV